MGGYRILASVTMCAFQHSTVAGGGRSLTCSCTPLALSIVCSPAPLSSLRAVVSDESSNEDGGDWPGSKGWHRRCGEMSGGVEIAFYFYVVCASPPSLCAAWRRAIKKKNPRKNARELAGGLVRDHARLKEHEKSQAKPHRKSANAKTHRF